MTMAYYEFVGKLDSKMRIKIPEEVIRQAGYKPGDALRIRTRPAQEEF